MSERIKTNTLTNRWSQRQPDHGRIVQVSDGTETYWTPLRSGERWQAVARAFAVGYDYSECTEIACEAKLIVGGNVTAEMGFCFGIHPPALAQEMTAPKPRKLKHRSHKNFGSNSRIVDGIGIKPEDAGGRSVGSKQICPGDYGARQTGGCGDYRSKAEKLNDAQRNHET